ncbi:hypothetical protein CDV31_017045 [Fusarium ambrosium]|uniref:Uncharacterized protein n=1 Tax=Fusarium ambrosium TaxID=131363 RepID=A0A428RUU9_9HYPO|nr:hypothetical protein CDV31_017045 [Fusarium ambrosium]
MSKYSDLLYHTTLTVIDYREDPSGAKHSAYVLATHASIEAAKTFARDALHLLKYEPDDFEEYSVYSSSHEWKHGDGVVVYARAPAGQVFQIGVRTTPNNESLLANPNGTVVLPKGADVLHYVVQTTVDYNKDRTGCAQEADIQGSYVLRADALAAAKSCLAQENLVEYDLWDEFKDEWPFGEDVVVHAVSETGQNHTVAVTTIPGAHKRHSKSN